MPTDRTHTPKRGYSYAQAGEYLGVSESVIRRLVTAGDLPCKYLGGRVVIDVDDLDAFFDALPSERK